MVRAFFRSGPTFFRSGIARNFFLYLMLFSILPLLAIGGSSYYFASQAITSQASRFAQETVDRERDMLDLRLDQIENLMSNILGDETINKVLRDKTQTANDYTRLATGARIGDILNGYLNLDGLVSIGIYGLDGSHYQVGDTLDTGEVRADVKSRLLAETLTAGGFIHWAGAIDNINAQSPHSRVLAATSLFLAVNDQTLEQGPLALLVANYNLETLAAGLQATKQEEGAFYMVLDGQNRLVYHPDAKLIGTSPSPEILRLIDFGAATGTVIQGKRMVVKSAVFKRNGWRIASFIPLSALTKPTNIIRTSTLIMLGLCLTVVSLLAYRYSKTVVAPIRGVTDAFKDFEKGELNPQDKLTARGSDEISELVRWHNSFLDVVRQQQEAKAALLESETRFRDFAEASSDWLWETDTEHRLTSVSERFFTTVNVAPETVLHRSRAELVERMHSDVDEYLLHQHLHDLAAHRPFRITYPMRDRDGVVHYLRSSGKPVFDADGTFRGYRGTGTDVSNEVRAERALIEMNRTLEERVRQRTEALRIEKERAELANRSKSEFLNNMSHELRTPLNAILGFTDVMKMGLFGVIGNDRYAGYVEDIHTSGSYLLDLISDILDLSRIEVGKLKLEEETVDVGATLAAISRMVSHKVKHNRISLTIDCPADLPRLAADPRRLKQILINLVSNAVKFTPAHGSVQVTARLTPGRGIEIAIADTGIGIAEEHQQIIFEPFGKVESSYAREHEGIGLGLAIVKALVQMHDGSLAMRSQLGEGTIMIVTFPADRTILTTDAVRMA
jgi:PAS domain S-box-containing protein